MDVHITRSRLRRAVRQLVPGCLDSCSHANFVARYGWADLECHHRVKGRNGGVHTRHEDIDFEPLSDTSAPSTYVARVTPDNPAIPVVKGGYPHSNDCPDDWAFVGQTGGTTRVK